MPSPSQTTTAWFDAVSMDTLQISGAIGVALVKLKGKINEHEPSVIVVVSKPALRLFLKLFWPPVLQE